MPESPLLQKMRAETIQKVILALLKDRFGKVRRDVIKHLREIIDEKKLRQLSLLTHRCHDLEAFREAILS